MLVSKRDGLWFWVTFIVLIFLTLKDVEARASGRTPMGEDLV